MHAIPGRWLAALPIARSFAILTSAIDIDALATELQSEQPDPARPLSSRTRLPIILIHKSIQRPRVNHRNAPCRTSPSRCRLFVPDHNGLMCALSTNLYMRSQRFMTLVLRNDPHDCARVRAETNTSDLRRSATVQCEGLLRKCCTTVPISGPGWTGASPRRLERATVAGIKPDGASEGSSSAGLGSSSRGPLLARRSLRRSACVRADKQVRAVGRGGHTPCTAGSGSLVVVRTRSDIHCQVVCR